MHRTAKLILTIMCLQTILATKLQLVSATNQKHTNALGRRKVANEFDLDVEEGILTWKVCNTYKAGIKGNDHEFKLSKVAKSSSRKCSYEDLRTEKVINWFMANGPIVISNTTTGIVLMANTKGAWFKFEKKQ